MMDFVKQSRPSSSEQNIMGSRDRKLFDAEMRLSILRTKLDEARRDRDLAVRQRRPTHMIETVIEIVQGDIARTTRYLDALREL